MSTVFRKWRGFLEKSGGPQPEWAHILAVALEELYQREKEIERPYREDIFQDRDDWGKGKGKAEFCDSNLDARISEDIYTYALYDRCHFGSSKAAHNSGCLTIGKDRFWLLGYQWPTRDGPIDLVGLKPNGGLVIFECKARVNNLTPLGAMLEGLDYLAAVLSDTNFDKLCGGFNKWKNKLTLANRVPPDFISVEPNRASDPSVVVLAPREYYFGSHSRSPRGVKGVSGGWARIAEVMRDATERLALRFAVCEFVATTEAVWLETIDGEG